MRPVVMVQWVLAAWNRVRSFGGRDRARDEIAEEMRFHRDRLADDLQRSGMDAGEAGRRAVLRFGNVTRLTEEAADVWRLGTAEDLWSDARFALRQWRRAPLLAGVAILSIAIGVGLNAGMFSLLNAALLRSLPVRAPAELRLIGTSGDVPGMSPYPWPLVTLLRAEARESADLAGVAPVNYLSVERDGVPVLTPNGGALVTGSYFDVLGVAPVTGRLLRESDEDDEGQADHVVVLSHAFWRSALGGDSKVVGRPLRFNGVSFMVIGVAPPGFLGTEPGRAPDAFFPLTADDAVLHQSPDYRKEKTNWWIQVFGRLRPGVSETQLAARLRRVTQQFHLEMEGPDLTAKLRDEIGRLSIRLEDGRSGFGTLRMQYTRPLQLLWILSAIVLLIACANVTSLILGRMEARQREFAVRTALGASGRRIARQVMIEGLLLTVVGSLVGLLLLRISGGVLRGVMFPMARRVPLDLSIDARGWFVAIAAVAVVGIGLAGVPAFAARRRDVSRALSQRSDRSSAGLRAGRALCVVQFALALPLVVCASLLARSIINLRQVDLGFDTSGVAIIRLDATRNDYSPSRLVMTYRSAIDALSALPGVRAVSATRYSPLSGSRSTNSFRIEGIPSPPDEGLDLQVMYVDPDYFRTLGVPLRSGREFTRADDPRLRNVAVVSESFARRHLGSSEAALGRRLGLDFDSTGRNDIVIIGVAPDARLNSPRVATPDVIYQPFLADSNNVGSATLLAATSRSVREVEPSLRQAIAAVDPRVEVLNIRAMDDQVDVMLSVERMVSRLTLIFGLLALLLAAIGIYGVFAHDVVRRSHEIGVRLALGASPAGIQSWVLTEATRLLLAGVVLGVPLAFMAARGARALFYGVTAADPVTVLGAAAVLVCTLVVAVWVPSRRAARTDPLTTIRAD